MHTDYCRYLLKNFNNLIPLPSFDIVSKIEIQALDNAVNVSVKEITNRYDFKDSQTTLTLNKKDYTIQIETENELRLKAVEDVLLSRSVKQGIDGRSFDFGREPYASGKMIKKALKVKAGIDREHAKKIIQTIKDTKLKVEAQIMDDQVRVTGKKIDDLQKIIQILKKTDIGIPLQIVNMK